MTGTTYSLPENQVVNWVYDNGAFTHEALDALTQAGNATPSDPTTQVNYVEATAESFYYDAATTTLYVNLGSPPAGHTVEAAIRQDAVFNNTHSHLAFDDLAATETAADNGGYAFRVQNGTGVTITACDASLAGKHHFGVIDAPGFVGTDLTATQAAPDQGFGGASAYVAFSDANDAGHRDASSWVDCTWTTPNGAYPIFVTHGDSTDSVGNILLQNLVSLNGYGTGISAQSDGADQVITIRGGHLDGGVIDDSASGSVVDGVLMTGADASINLSGNNDVVQNCVFTGLAPNPQAGRNGAVVVSGTGSIVRFDTFDTSPAGDPAIAIEAANLGTAVYGDVFVDPEAIALQYAGASAADSGVTSGYNLLSTSSTVNFSVGSTSGPTYLSLAQWQAGGNDTTSVVGDPQFTDEATGDFTIPPTSPAVDLYTGTPATTVAAVTTDYAGNPRPFGGGYDAGAYEVQAAKVSTLGTFSVAGTATPNLLPGTTGSATFVVTLSNALTFPATVTYATADGSAVAGTDYTATTGTLTFPAGTTTESVAVPVLGTSTSAAARTFTLAITAATPQTAVLTGSATATVGGTAETVNSFDKKKALSYTDPAGHAVVVRLAGPGTGQLLFVNGVTSPAQIGLTGTTAGTTVTVTVAGGAATPLGQITATTPVGGFTAPSATLADGGTFSGGLARGTFGSVTGPVTLTIGGTARPTLRFGAVSGLTLTSAAPIAGLTAASWSGPIAAPAVSTLKVTGAFAGDLALTGAGVDLNSAALGSVAGGTWTLAGSANAVRVGGNLASATITLTGTAGRYAVNSLTVGGTLSATTIRAAGGINAVKAGTVTGSTVYAGVSPTVTGLPTAATAFASAATINSFTANGFAGSDVAASTLTHVKVAGVTTANGGVPFGFAAHALTTFSGAVAGGKPVVYTKRSSPSVLTFAGDFKVSLL